jgi:hypothetical protein
MRQDRARRIIELFEALDCDTIDEAETLCKDAGRVYNEDTDEITYGSNVLEKAKRLNDEAEKKKHDEEERQQAYRRSVQERLAKMRSIVKEVLDRLASAGVGFEVTTSEHVNLLHRGRLILYFVIREYHGTWDPSDDCRNYPYDEIQTVAMKNNQRGQDDVAFIIGTFPHGFSKVREALEDRLAALIRHDLR